MLGGEISTEGRIHGSGRWVTFPLLVGGTQVLWMVLDTGAPVSALNPRIKDELEHRSLLSPSPRPNLYRLRDLEFGGKQVADMEVGVVRRLERLDIEGVLGLDFLSNFQDIHFNLPSLRLRLVPPASR